MKRYRAEYTQISQGGNILEQDNEEVIRNEIEKIREDIFNLPFQESGQEIISKF
jgi:hypothetical protein